MVAPFLKEVLWEREMMVKETDQNNFVEFLAGRASSSGWRSRTAL
jgi:hypothetical protein